MRSRLWIWLVGSSCLLGLLSVAIGVGAMEPTAALILGAGWLILFVATEAWLGQSSGSTKAGPAKIRDLRLADGKVGLARLSGVDRETSLWDPRFGRLIGLGVGERSRPGSLPRRRSPPLLGRVVVFSIFLGRDGRPWSDSELFEAHRSLKRATTWIEREANRLAASVNLDLADTYILAQDEQTPTPAEIEFAPGLGAGGIEPFERDKEVTLIAALSRAIARLDLGVRDLAELIAAVEPRVEADARVWLLHPRSAGQSWAISEAEIGLPGVSLAVCYARETKFSAELGRRPFADPVSIAHELLHLFGATDKYGSPLSGFPAGLVSRRDIMRLDYETLSALRIDPLTAREIGWEDPSPAIDSP